MLSAERGGTQLASGRELALAEGADSTPVTGSNQQPGGTRPSAASVAEKLKQVTSLGFARDTLEKAIQMLADDIGVKYEILGSDLQVEGITKNQSFGLDEKNKPGRRNPAEDHVQSQSRR